MGPFASSSMPPRSSKSKGPAPFALAPARWDQRRRRQDSPDESDVDGEAVPRETVKQTPFRVIKEPELRPIPSPPWKSRPLKRPGEFEEEAGRNVRTVAPHHPTYEVQHSRNGEFCSSSSSRNGEFCSSSKGKGLPPMRSLSPPHSAISRPLLPSSSAYYPPPPTEAYQFRSYSRTPDCSTKNSNGNSTDDEMHGGARERRRRPASPGQRDARHRRYPSPPPPLSVPSQNHQIPSRPSWNNTSDDDMHRGNAPSQYDHRRPGPPPLPVPAQTRQMPSRPPGYTSDDDMLGGPRVIQYNVSPGQRHHRYPPPPPMPSRPAGNISDDEAQYNRRPGQRHHRCPSPPLPMPSRPPGNISDDDMLGGPQAQYNRRPVSPGQRHHRYPSPPPPLSVPSQRRQVPSQLPPPLHSPPLHRRVPSHPQPASAQHRIASQSHSVPPSPLPPPPSTSSSSGSSQRRGPQPAPPGPNHGFHSLTRRDLPSALDLPGDWYEKEKREREYQARLRRDEYYEERHRQHDARYPRSPPPPLQQQQRHLRGPTPPLGFNSHVHAPLHSPPMDSLPPLPYQQHGPSHHQRQTPYQYSSYPPPPPPSHVPSHAPTLGRPPKLKRVANPKPRAKRPSQPLPKHQRLLQTPTPSPPPGTRRAVPPPAPHVWVSMGGHGYGPEGGYEVHLHGKGRKERTVNGHGQCQPLDGSTSTGGDNGRVTNGDGGEEHPIRNGNANDEGSRGGHTPLPISYPAAPPPQTAFSLSTGPQEHLMMIPMNHVGGAQFVLKPPKMPRARGRGRGRPRADAGIGEKIMETDMTVVEEVDGRDVGPDKSVEETTATTTTMTSVNGGEDPVRNDECDVSDASASEDDDDDESVDSSHYALHPDASAQHAEAHMSSLPPGSSAIQPDPGGSETNTFAAPPRPSRKIKRYPCDVCGQIFTRSGDVRRHKESRHSEGSTGCRCPFCGRVLTRQDALQRHWDKYCRKRSKRHLERQTMAVGSSGPSGMGALVGGVNGMVMSRIVGHGQGAMQEVGGVMGVMDASFEEIGPSMRRRGSSVSSAEGDSVPGGSVRNGSLSRGRSVSRSWSPSRSPSRSRSRSRSASVEIIENPNARTNPSDRSPPTAGANARATSPDEVPRPEGGFMETS